MKFTCESQIENICMHERKRVILVLDKLYDKCII